MPRERWENLLRHPRWWMSPFSLCLKIQISVFSRVLCWRPRSLVWSLLENCGEALGGDITTLCPCCWQNTHVHIWDTLANIYMLIKCRGAVCTCSIRSFHHAQHLWKMWPIADRLRQKTVEAPGEGWVGSGHMLAGWATSQPPLWLISKKSLHSSDKNNKNKVKFTLFLHFRPKHWA